MQNRMFFVILRPISWEKWKIAPPFENSPPLKRLNLRNWTKNPSQFRWSLFFFFWRSPTFGRKISDFGRKFALNFGEDLFFFNFYFFGDHLILGEKFRISAKNSLSILVKTLFFFFFFFWRSPDLGRKKALSFRAFREFSSQFSDKPYETASRLMKIPVKIVCTLLTLSK